MTSIATLNTARPCPLCGGAGQGRAFPFATRFNGKLFNYLACSACSCVYVDPVPDDESFARMYAKAQYHDTHYEAVEDNAYMESATLLRKVLPPGARVLDYGCGTGGFLRALQVVDLVPFGVEFDREAAEAAGRKSGCQVMTVADFGAKTEERFDAIHLGDVLEHLPQPADVLRQLLARLRPGGILFVEGPLEVNPSPVYWSAALFGWAKRLARPGFVAAHPPTHLFRANARQQFAFFGRVEPGLSVRSWVLSETGWPYANGGRLKRWIARFSVAIASFSPRLSLGNRFRGLFVYQPTEAGRSAGDDEPRSVKP